MRRLLERLGLAAPVGGALGLAKTLYSLGEIGDADLEAISSGLRHRNAIAHGFVPRNERTHVELERALAIFLRLAEQAARPPNAAG
jgi:hypothetical protein